MFDVIIHFSANQGAEWGDDGVLLFEPHSRPVGSMAFSRCHPNQLLSASYDGSLRCMNVEKAVFDDVRTVINSQAHLFKI